MGDHNFFTISHINSMKSRVGCPNRTEPRPNRNRNSEKPKPQTAIFSQNHGLQFFARNSAQKWSKLLNFKKVHNFPLSSLLIAECPRRLISLKCLVYFHEYAEFDKI